MTAKVLGCRGSRSRGKDGRRGRAIKASEFELSLRANCINLRFRGIGPFYTSRCYAEDGDKLVGELGGFVAPPVLHIDSARVYNASGIEMPMFGLAPILACRAMLWGRGWGCRRAQILAVDDDMVTHSRLGSKVAFPKQLSHL